MRFFFRSKQFRVILCVFLILAIVSTVFYFTSKQMAPQTNIIGTVTAPFKTAVKAVSNWTSDFVTAYSDGNRLMLENAELNKQINELRDQLAEYNDAVAQNEFYKKYLELKENNPDYKFAAATLISADSDNPYHNFVINKGSSSDISAYDPVITDAGLVGYITEVGLTTAKVTTILSPDLTLGALDNRTNDSGIISGELELATNGYCNFGNLSRSCSIAVGDYVMTSGEGIFPSGLKIGSIESIGSDKYNTSIYADIKPFVDFSSIRSVMVITSFKGQGGIKVAPEGK